MDFKQLDMNTDRMPNGCWVWKNSVNKAGAPTWYDPQDSGMRFMSARHRAYNLYAEEEVSSDYKIHMTCNTERCICPSHMVAVKVKTWSLTPRWKKN